MSRQKDFSNYVRVTSDGSVAVRGSVDELWPDERERPEWVNSGWSPQMARGLADHIRKAADFAEEQARYPAYWPPQPGDIWLEKTSGKPKRLLVLAVDKLPGFESKFTAVDTVSGLPVESSLAQGTINQSAYVALIYRKGVKP